MNDKNKIFNTLIKTYVFFSLTLGISVVVLLVILNFQMKQKFENTVLSNLRATEIVRQNYSDIPTDAIESFNGWIEILDENLHVVYIKGKKQDNSFAYTEKELNSLFYDQKENPYHTSLAPFKTKDGKMAYCLIKIPKTYIKQEFTVTSAAKDHITAFIKLLLQTFLLFLFLFGINVYIYSRWMAMKITNPLLSIANGIRNITNGYYYKRLHFKANYELMKIQNYFNLMAEKLEKTEMEKKQLEESKKRMLVHISHDLKTPITTIQGYVEALQMGLIKEEAKKQQALRIIHTKARLVTELIEDVFELSKLESTDYPFVTEILDISEFIREISAEYYGLFEEKHVHFQFEIPSQEILVSFNYTLLYRAISNVLSNALKYNPEGTNVFVSLIEDTQKIHINIIDDGIGIPNSIKEKVFEAFFRGDQSRKSDGGTGLGLTISKHIAEKHGGQIYLHTDEGKTKFQITLPKAGYN
ncbi:HAMP domain-containing histidine kinase [Bacillus sp. Xin]|uniref:sensor histidine kinase n=1 Tax=unclassified Bacillus (in: firmicutes) TaxID=185979 RepID=UPI0015737AB2|nr:MULTISPECIES: HAMP domain-containing sensor histidine kinase [unclassified Bacillus (in: firmicutes)]MBC6972431.1 HAMP domain-containing histidine kinase [Bacillus sp. Xin]NSW39519.1 HAMP domain-containing histidine kinase [Bacillus sp. Xin1]